MTILSCHFSSTSWNSLNRQFNWIPNKGEMHENSENSVCVRAWLRTTPNETLLIFAISFAIVFKSKWLPGENDFLVPTICAHFRHIHK